MSKKAKKETGAFKTSAISQPDKRQAKTGAALPDDSNVIEARDWVNFNKK
jgi:hypothetical protein